MLVFNFQCKLGAGAGINRHAAAPRLVGYRLGNPLSAIYPPEHQQSPPQPQPLPPRRSWPRRHKILIVLGSGFGLALALTACGGSPAPAPTVTLIQHDPGATVTVTATPAATVTETVTPTANAQGQATQISADGVYVIGSDIPGGTWHTSGGQQCYEATLASTDTNNIMDNNNFTGPDTVDLSGAKAFDVTGGCTWQQISS